MIPRALQIALHVHTAAIKRSIAEYRERPTAACPSLHDPEPCADLAMTGDRYCRRHRAIADKKRDQHERKKS